MRAFVIEHAGDDESAQKQSVGVLKTDQPVPVPKSGEALVRVLRAGVCNTDLELLAGYMGFTGIVGHEFVGVVEKVEPYADDEGDDGSRPSAAFLVGKRVVGEINLACTRCRVCQGGGDRARNHCPERTVLGILGKHGTYAEYLTLPCRNLHVVPDNVSDAAAVFAEPLAAACRIVEQDLVPTEANAAVIGDGKLGLLVSEVLARRATAAAAAAAESGGGLHTAADVVGATTLIGRHRENMDLCCSSSSGGGRAPDSGQSGPLPPPPLARVDARDKAAVTALAGSFDAVVDATGSPQGLASACELCRPMGTIVLKSTCAAGAGFNPAPVVINEQRIVGSRCGPFEAALRMLADPDGGIDVERYVSGVFPLEEAAAAMLAARQKGTLKVQIICS